MSGLTKPDEPTKLVKRLFNLAGMVKRPKPAVGMTPSDVVFRENKLRLIRYRPRAAGVAYRKPVLLVPSLINRHYVLDLMPGKSFAEWLVARGHDVYVIDWGTPGKEDRYVTFDEICDGYLGRAIRQVSKRTRGEQVHVLGYCLGGTLSTIHVAAHPEHVASLVDIAAPVAFGDADGGLLERWTKNPKFDLDAILNAYGNVPWQLMQTAFEMLRPTLKLAKNVYMIDRAWDDEFLDGFFALEAWGNDNVSFPGLAFKKYIEELYQKNALIRGELTLSGERVDLARITCPLLNISFEHDNIVTVKSAAALNELVSSTDKELLKMPGGHVGAVVSKSASRGLWPKISEFWATRDGAALTTDESGALPKTTHARPLETAASPSVASMLSSGTGTVLAAPIVAPMSMPAPPIALEALEPSAMDVTPAKRRATKSRRNTNRR